MLAAAAAAGLVVRRRQVRFALAAQAAVVQRAGRNW